MKLSGWMLFVFMTVVSRLCATTWDEPWMDKVIADADSFVKVSILKSTPERFSAKVLKHLAGRATPRKIEINGYSLLSIGSISAGTDELSLRFNPTLTYYLFLRATTKPGVYLIATPETGWAKIISDGVNATYRHSYHQAVVPEDVYELTMTAIFNRLHGDKFDSKTLSHFMREHLSLAPALPGKSDGDPEVLKEFFLQHAALESFRYCGSSDMLPLLDPFLNADDFHVQISAVRALACVDSTPARDRNWDFIASHRFGFAKIMALWNLEKWNAREYLLRLKEFVRVNEDEETGFGGNVMDPRVGTRFPSSVNSAAMELIAKWEDREAR